MVNSIIGSPIFIRLADENQEMVNRFAQMTKRSRSFVINEAVEQCMRDRIQHLDELTDAVADAKSSYGHSSDQIHAWMRSWGREDEQASPEPDITPDH